MWNLKIDKLFTLKTKVVIWGYLTTFNSKLTSSNNISKSSIATLLSQHLFHSLSWSTLSLLFFLLFGFPVFPPLFTLLSRLFTPSFGSNTAVARANDSKHTTNQALGSWVVCGGGMSGDVNVVIFKVFKSVLGTLFTINKTLKTSTLKTRKIKSLMEEEIPSGTKWGVRFNSCILIRITLFYYKLYLTVQSYHGIYLSLFLNCDSNLFKFGLDLEKKWYCLNYVVSIYSNAK